MQEETIMHKTPSSTHDLAFYLGLNAALSSLIFVSLLVAGVL
ncbi:hypothetical protein EDF70_1262 [Neorhizobium sp. JUb45]|nr:hypothetical protein EDF70_1262 [Neorhizobium sp. JUb45]